MLEERAHFFGKQQVLYPEVRDLDEYFSLIEKVDESQVNTLAAHLLTTDNLRLVVIGKEKDTDQLNKLIA